MLVDGGVPSATTKCLPFFCCFFCQVSDFQPSGISCRGGFSGHIGLLADVKPQARNDLATELIRALDIEAGGRQRCRKAWKKKGKKEEEEEEEEEEERQNLAMTS